MAGDGFQVTVDDLATHAKAVEQVAVELDQALSAAEQVTVGVQAYGMICGPLFVPIVLAVSTPGLITLGMAHQAINSVAQTVTTTSTLYQNVDQAHARNLTSLHQDL